MRKSCCAAPAPTSVTTSPATCCGRTGSPSIDRLPGGPTIPSVNPLRRVFLGSGRLPDDLRRSLDAEGVLLLEEGLPGTVTYINYRAPHQYSSWRKVPFAGSIAITGRRLVVV